VTINEGEAMANIGEGRALQVCDYCGGVDDHPRHHAGGGHAGIYDEPTPELVRSVAAATLDLPGDVADRLMAELLDTGTTSRHKDCCRAAGCPTGDCDRQLAGWDGATGAALLAHILKGAPQ
jgi:hypothetical protein